MGTGSKDYVFPNWLNNTFIENILKRKYVGETIKVLKIHSTNIDAKGTSFCSEMHRVAVELEKDGNLQKLSLILKVQPKGVAGEICKNNLLFEREMNVYSNILPKTYDLLHSIGDNTMISPICYSTCKGTPENMLVLQDMNSCNFQMFEKGRLLNLEHILPVIKKIAKLHACSAVITEDDPTLMGIHLDGPISRHPDRQTFLEFFPANMWSLAEQVDQWPGYENIAKKLHNLEKCIIRKAQEMYDPEPETFRVLNLGDLWINNIMFQWDDEFVPTDVVLLDYQLSYYGSPAIDLNYLLFGSLNENMRKVHFKFIIYEYHRHLTDTLKKLNYQGQIPTLRDIHIEIIRKGLHAVIASVCLTPILLMEEKTITEIEGLFDRSERGNELRRANVQNPKYKTFIQRTLKEFELSGFLD